MSYALGPAQGPTKSLRSKLRNAVARVEFSVTSRAELNLVWKTFLQCERWNQYLNAYGKMRWFGEPWAPGSRLQIELLRPFYATQDRVITVCNPPRCVGWINHVSGFTMEQWVLFDPHPGNGTVISTWIEIAGADLNVQGEDVESIVRKSVITWYTNFAMACDRFVTAV